MEAAASIVGIVSFGLALAKGLQAFIDSVIEAEETVTLIVADVNATASTLKRLQEFIDQDKTASEDEHRATVFNGTAIKEIGACALQCQKIYLQIIILIEKARIQAEEDAARGPERQPSVAEDLSSPAVRLAAFNKNVTTLGRRMRWPWLEPRIKRCQEHLGRLKVSLLLSLQVFSIAESRARPIVAMVLGTDCEKEMRDRAETLRKRMNETRAINSAAEQPDRQLPRSDDVITIGRNVGSRSSIATYMTVTSTSTGLRRSTSRARSRSRERPSWASLRGHRSRKPSGFRISGAMRAFRAFKVHVRKRDESKEVFKRDSKSFTFEAYLIYPFPPPPPGLSQHSFKLPFGHRRLTKEIKRALRRWDPWDVLLGLSHQYRVIIDAVVQGVQLAAAGSTNVYLVAIDLEGYGDKNLSELDVSEFSISSMVLFFRHEPVGVRKEELEPDMTWGRPRFTDTVREMFLAGRGKSKTRVEPQEISKQEEEERARKEAKNKADIESIEKSRAEIEEARKNLEAEKKRIKVERDLVVRKQQALKDAEEAALKGVKKSDSEEELKKVAAAERSHRMLEEERAKIKASEEKAAADKAKPPIRFKDAVGRKFAFPFHLVQTWEGMEDLIKQAFIHVDSIGPQVLEGHYDLTDSEGQIILPSLWSSSILPGDSVYMRMWPLKEEPPPQQPASPFPGRPMQPMPLPETGLLAGSSYVGLPSPPHPPGRTSPSLSEPTYPQPLRMPTAPMIHSRHSRERVAAAIDEAAAAHGLAISLAKGRRPKKGNAPLLKKKLGFFGSKKPRKRGSTDNNRLGYLRSEILPHNKHVHIGGNGEGFFEDMDDIDKELGLDNLDRAEQLAAKDIDELLETWTSVGGKE